MVELTGALTAEVLRMRHDSDRSAAAIRVAQRPDGTFALEFDDKTDEDICLAADSGAVNVIISRALAEQLDDAVLHFRGPGDDRYGRPGLVVLHVRPGPTRRQWVAPAPPSRAPLLARLRRGSTAKHTASSASQTASL